MEGDIAGDRAGDACVKGDAPGQEYHSGSFLKDCSPGQPKPGHGHPQRNCSPCSSALYGAEKNE